MYKAQFDKHNKSHKAYLFWGEEPYYIQKYGQDTAQKIGNENSMKLYFEEYDYESAKNYLSQASLFGDINLLHIKHDKALPKKELTSLLEICQKTPNSYLIYELYGSDGKKIANLFDAKHGGVHVRFFKPQLHEAKAELLSFAQQKNIPIDSFTIEHMLTLLDNNLSYALKELEKLSLLDRKIEPKDVDSLVYAINPLQLEKLYMAIIKKEPIHTYLEKILEEEQNEMRILLGLENFLQQLFMIYAYIRLHGSFDSSAVLGYKLPKRIEEERIALAMRIKKYPQIFLHLQDCELRLKTQSAIDKQGLLLSCLIKLQEYF
ncbi:DNA polymerase III subunit delta [Nitratiruptor sp. YY09-18]|uniref:DNA polymerase III subunit delta n=1 Tax=Nitratiruptor sp. YY09-18 TaxID=2724901 RepID=UPI001915A418|nr:DNA polymerase III subunit delta [Nitratiruptor sp. YY09-18]BCD67836.1 DNA polymerase III subunit delta [Nitratiruptor sp. YY09-18]